MLLVYICSVREIASWCEIVNFENTVQDLNACHAVQKKKKKKKWKLTTKREGEIGLIRALCLDKGSFYLLFMTIISVDVGSKGRFPTEGNEKDKWKNLNIAPTIIKSEICEL